MGDESGHRTEYGKWPFPKGSMGLSDYPSPSTCEKQDTSIVAACQIVHRLSQCIQGANITQDPIVLRSAAITQRRPLSSHHPCQPQHLHLVLSQSTGPSVDAKGMHREETYHSDPCHGPCPRTRGPPFPCTAPCLWLAPAPAALVLKASKELGDVTAECRRCPRVARDNPDILATCGESRE